MSPTKFIFSVHLGPSNQISEVTGYLEHLVQVQAGVLQLLKPLCRQTEVSMYKRTCTENSEWLDVHLNEGAQLSFVDELERSIDSRLTHLDIEHNAAEQLTAQALRTIRELQVRRTWRSAEFLDLVHRRTSSRDLVAVGRKLQTGERNVQVLFARGQTSRANVPSRRFSAICDESVELQFRLTHVGFDRAFVALSESAKHRITARSRRIEITWHESIGDTMSDRLFQAAKTRTWITAQCKVVVNGGGVPKSLLLEEFSA
jgi:hypothetical protein